MMLVQSVVLLIKGDDIRDDSGSAALQHCFEQLQHCSNIVTVCCEKIVVANRPV